MSWVVAIFPFAFVFFVLLLSGAFSGRANHGSGVQRPAAPVALAVAIMLLLVIGGLLLIGGVYLARMPVPPPDFLSSPMPPQEPWPTLPGAAPSISSQEDFSALPERLIAEVPESSDLAASSDQPVDASKSTESSVRSSGEPPTARPRPAWMDAPKGRVDDVYRTTVTVGPWLTRTECEQQLPDALRNAVKTYADRLLGEGKGEHVNLPMSYIHDHIVRDEWEEHRQQTIDNMIYLHELLQFDPDARAAIEANYKQSVVTERLGYTAAGGGALLAVLSIVFGYLKLDTLTRGYYTWRLRFTAATAIMVGVALIVGLLFMA